MEKGETNGQVACAGVPRMCGCSSPTGNRELPDGPWREATMSLFW